MAVGAEAHFQVTKQLKAGRTLSEIRRLDPDERIEELARMLGGQTDAARRHARAMCLARKSHPRARGMPETEASEVSDRQNHRHQP